MSAIEARLKALEDENAALKAARADAATAPKMTTMVGWPKGTKLVKIRAKTDIRVHPTDPTVIASGKIVEVPEDVAAEFCDTKFIGNFDFGGERSEATSTRNVRTRAERVA
jgi:hypothetical protein